MSKVWVSYVVGCARARDMALLEAALAELSRLSDEPMTSSLEMWVMYAVGCAQARDMALLEAALAELTKERRFGSGKGGQTTDAPGPLQVRPLRDCICTEIAFVSRSAAVSGSCFCELIHDTQAILPSHQPCWAVRQRPILSLSHVLLVQHPWLQSLGTCGLEWSQDPWQHKLQQQRTGYREACTAAVAG